MKATVQNFACIALLLVLPIRSADSDGGKATTIEHRIREIDLSVILQCYERLRKEVFESHTKRFLLSTEVNLSKEEREKTDQLLGKRIEILQQQVDMFRALAISFESKITPAKSK
jgi:predicted RNase H-like nuclease